MNELLSDFILVSKYLRYNDKLQRRETWDEAIDRVLEMFYRRTPKSAHDLVKDIEEPLRQKRVMPSMRCLQYAGPALERVNMRMYNCFQRDTQFVTTDGVKSFEDYNDGDHITVRTHTGKYSSAVVRQYGTQKLHKIHLRHQNTDKFVYATRNHRWVLRDGAVTDHLEIGDALYPIGAVEEFDWNDATIPEKLWWCYGFVYGDGTIHAQRYSLVRLCGEKAQYLDRFTSLGFSCSYPPSNDGDPVVYTGKYTKTLPSESDDSTLIRAFLEGYLAADGCRENRKLCRIFTSNPKSAEFLTKFLPLAGYYIISIANISRKTNHGEHVNAKDIRFNKSPKYRVAGISEEIIEDTVWCLEVEDDQSFVLPFGAPTGNCVGAPIEGYNLPKELSKVMYTLMCGNGTGFKLPPPDHRVETSVYHGRGPRWVVPDTLEGWAQSIEVLLIDLIEHGNRPNFDYSEIRPKGSPLMIGGGLAPGPEPIYKAHENIAKLVLGRDYLRTIDIYDIIMFLAQAVLSGGVRRAATIALFDPADGRMASAKTGDWFERHPQRAYSNNSALLPRFQCNRDTFDWYFESTRQYGEPGIVFVDDTKYESTNPCGEIRFTHRDLVTGWPGLQVCNLTTINAAMIESPQDFYEACILATKLGTIQAQFTDFDPNFITEIDKRVIERDRLLGVSICGVLDKWEILQPTVLAKGKMLTEVANDLAAIKLGINSAARITTIKPEGTASLVLGASAGVHPRQARKYIRRVQVNMQDPIGQYMREQNPSIDAGASVYDPGSRVFEFPVEAPETCLTKDDLTALDFLRVVKDVKTYWCGEGHNVSNTVNVKDHEWQGVQDFIWENQDVFAGISLFPDRGTVYPQQPEEALHTPELQARFDELKRTLKPVDYTQLKEVRDGTTIHNEFACIGGSCTI